MFKRNTEKAELQWKSKYFNSLEELETKEKHWSVLESAMRTSISRMSVLLDGLDKDLDKELDYLRHSIRKNADGKKIRALLESIFGTLEKVEKRRAKRKRLSAADAYELLLDRLSLPKACGKKIKALRKSISRLTEDDSPVDVIREFEELIQYSLDLIKPDKDSQQDHAQEKVTIVEKQVVVEQKVAAPPTEAIDLSGRVVLQELLGKLLLPGELGNDVKAVQMRLKSVQMTEELNRLAEQIASMINDAFPGDNIDEFLQGEGGMTINEVLLQLLEKIELPVDVNDDALEIQHQLEGEVSQEEWPELLERISRLIRSMREQANEEKKSLESFLSQLTEQLQTLDNFISSVENDHNDSIHHGQELGERMREHIDHIGHSVDQASEIDQLKLAVRARLETIAEHMSEFHRYEEERDVHAQEKIKELNEKIKSMEEDSESLRKKVKDERESALTDQLTEIKNRLAYDERIAHEYALWKRYHTPISLIVIDIDFFKKINDSYGHIAGDKVLHTVAQNLQSSIRETDFLARYGGEEFVIIMPATGEEDGLGVAEKLRQAVESCGFHYRGDAVKVTISCGVAEFSTDDTPQSVFEKADAAMYRAKSEGRNRCYTHNQLS